MCESLLLGQRRGSSPWPTSSTIASVPAARTLNGNGVRCSSSRTSSTGWAKFIEKVARPSAKLRIWTSEAASIEPRRRPRSSSAGRSRAADPPRPGPGPNTPVGRRPRRLAPDRGGVLPADPDPAPPRRARSRPSPAPLAASTAPCIRSAIWTASWALTLIRSARRRAFSCSSSSRRLSPVIVATRCGQLAQRFLGHRAQPRNGRGRLAPTAYSSSCSASPQSTSRR